MGATFEEIVKHFELKLNRKLTDVEYKLLYLNYLKSSKNLK